MLFVVGDDMSGGDDTIGRILGRMMEASVRHALQELFLQMPLLLSSTILLLFLRPLFNLSLSLDKGKIPTLIAKKYHFSSYIFES